LESTTTFQIVKLTSYRNEIFSQTKSQESQWRRRRRRRYKAWEAWNNSIIIKRYNILDRNWQRS